MSKNSPPLHLLSIFEACARLGSFKSASEELFITPSAVSHQIRSLEQLLGFNLFYRQGRGVKLTSAGNLYFGYVHDAINLIDEGTLRVKSKHASPCLKISTFSSLASKVLIPQLGLFQQAHPEIEIRIETSTDMSDLRYEDYDLAVRLGRGNWEDVSVHKLFDVEVGVVCSPEFVQRYDIGSIESIESLPLIQMTNVKHAWQRFLSVNNVELKEPNFAFSFNNYDAAVHAAEQGLGLSLAMFPIEQSSLERRNLIEPFGVRIKYDDSVYAVHRQADKERHDIHCFLRWISNHYE
jgi:LysR family glycine cleavage system transcriptional activator